MHQPGTRWLQIYTPYGWIPEAVDGVTIIEPAVPARARAPRIWSCRCKPSDERPERAATTNRFADRQPDQHQCTVR